MRDLSIIGKKFGRLTVVSADANRPGSYWNCLCKCGQRKSVFLSSLKRGATRSCGCLARQSASSNSTHGATAGGKMTPEYRSWKAMRERCQNPNHVHYKNYGGRGITVCEQWGDFSRFLSDMGPRPKGTSIDRKKSDEGYSPSNCRWASRKVQNTNARHVIPVIRSDGKIFKSISDAARSVDGHASAISRAIRSGHKHKGYEWQQFHASKAAVLDWGHALLGVK